MGNIYSELGGLLLLLTCAEGPERDEDWLPIVLNLATPVDGGSSVVSHLLMLPVMSAK